MKVKQLSPNHRDQQRAFQCAAEEIAGGASQGSSDPASFGIEIRNVFRKLQFTSPKTTVPGTSFWQKHCPAAIFDAIWEMINDHRLLTHHDTIEPRLQRANEYFGKA